VSFGGPARYAPDAVRNFRQFSALLAPLQLRVAGVQISDRASWSLTTVPRVQVELGRDEPPDACSSAWHDRGGLPVRDGTAGPDRPTRVDARFSNGFRGGQDKKMTTA